MDDEDTLRELNLRIGTAETEGDSAFLSEVVAPALGFRRASGAIVDRQGFLDGVKPSAHRETEIESITLHGHDRAVVTCMVTMADGDQKRRFHNVRLFVRAGGGAWQLLAWANEPA